MTFTIQVGGTRDNFLERSILLANKIIEQFFIIMSLFSRFGLKPESLH